MDIDLFLDHFCRSANNRTWAILKALSTGTGHNELAFYALVLQYNVHPNKKRWNIIYKLFLMARDSGVEAKIRAGQINQLSALQLKYYLDPAMALSPARQALKSKYTNEIFPELQKTFEKGDPAKGRKKVSGLAGLGLKLTAYKRKVSKGDFDAVIAQITRADGPIDRFAKSIGSYPTIHDLAAGTDAARLRSAIYNASHGSDAIDTKEHWMTNLQATLPQYDLDPDDAGLGCDMSGYLS